MYLKQIFSTLFSQLYKKMNENQYIFDNKDTIKDWFEHLYCCNTIFQIVILSEFIRLSKLHQFRLVYITCVLAYA